MLPHTVAPAQPRHILLTTPAPLLVSCQEQPNTSILAMVIASGENRYDMTKLGSVIFSDQSSEKIMHVEI